jgi:peroxiredoxin Q/BCP
MLLKIGDKAPEFALQSSMGDTVRLSDYSGKNYVALIFYPGDETPGCTKQLCAVRNDFAEFQAKHVKVFGINPADAASHRKFVERHAFPFPLLVDPDRETAKRYGCAGTLFIKRTVFVIDPNGAIIYMKQGMPSDGEILKVVPETNKSEK